ncbi:uncharacterized protein PHALS_02934 [Plasmopara halstedii]|uniref:Uncharacterized protein n=1 Tax=Plasmopara halstedii TaxID=4781 RepID=A0A0P1B052_PLAHL|nr:uncharacterized protein PHALS_02934 [Plasmopara halstedii]CEG46534.1 hypothetical protein PHALS_02934 [Plasmopara halstedii]|eukprot:XP_024582903.1 hypothetical protein PHALS_02934 [Plasmopara halstedii]
MRVAVDVGNGATGCPEARFRLNTVYRAEGSSARETDMGRRARSKAMTKARARTAGPRRVT